MSGKPSRPGEDDGSRKPSRTRNRGADDQEELLSAASYSTTSLSMQEAAAAAVAAAQDVLNEIPKCIPSSSTLVDVHPTPGCSYYSPTLGKDADKCDLTQGLSFPDGGSDMSARRGSLPRDRDLLSRGIDFVTKFATSGSADKDTPSFIENAACIYLQELAGGRVANRPRWYRWLRMALLILMWTIFTVVLMYVREREDGIHQISVPKNQVKSYLMQEIPTKRQVSVMISGALLPPEYGNLTDSFLHVWIEMIKTKKPLDEKQRANVSLHINKEDIRDIRNVTRPWRVPLVSSDLVDHVPEVKRSHVFPLDDFEISKVNVLRLQLRTNLHVSFPAAMRYDTSPINVDDGIIYAAIVLVGLYVLIIGEIVHRTVAAMMASTMSLAILAAYNERPTMTELIRWIDMETLLLLFSMMVMVAVFARSGVFDFLAIYAYKITGGKRWPMINMLCAMTVVLSIFLDNVTTILLMTPVTIRLSEVVEMNTVMTLYAMIIYSNIGGAITPVGDPPNVILANNEDIVKSGVDFVVFTLHMGIGTLIVCLVVNIQLRFMFKHMGDLTGGPRGVAQLRHKYIIATRAAASMPSYTHDENSVRRDMEEQARKLSVQLYERLTRSKDTPESSEEQPRPKVSVEQLQAMYPLHDVELLQKSGFVIAFVVLLFILQSFMHINLSYGWTALLGVILLFIITDNVELEGVMSRVEWATLLFFAALFILMEALSRLGLIDWIGQQTESLILSVPVSYRLAVAILLILWVSAIASAFVDNIPLTTMMVRIVCSLARNPELALPLQPLVWALAFGACFGGNGTMVGSSANVVCAGVVEQHGYRFTFWDYFKYGFPVVLVSVSTITVYLMISHVIIGWNGPSFPLLP